MSKRLISILAAVLFSACTPGIEGLIHDKSLSRLSLQQGGITVAGVTDKGNTLEETGLSTAAELLRQELQDELKGVAIIPENDLLNALQREEHSLIVEEFARRGTLSAANLNRLRDKTSSRYVALAIVDSNKIIHQRSNQLETLDKSGKVLRPAATTSTTQRSMHTRLYLFDLHSGKRVWGGSISLSRNKSRTYEHDSAAVNIIRGISALANGLDAAYPYPEPPAEGRLLADIFDGFAENLAKIK